MATITFTISDNLTNKGVDIRVKADPEPPTDPEQATPAHRLAMLVAASIEHIHHHHLEHKTRTNGAGKN